VCVCACVRDKVIISGTRDHCVCGHGIGVQLAQKFVCAEQG
jgi:hypothetical protein